MALLGTETKQPREVLDFDIDYTAALAGRSDTIASQTTEVTPAGLTVSNSRSGNIVKVRCSAGTDLVSYKVTILATTTAGLVFEDEFMLDVEEV